LNGLPAGQNLEHSTYYWPGGAARHHPPPPPGTCWPVWASCHRASRTTYQHSARFGRPAGRFINPSYLSRHRCGRRLHPMFGTAYPPGSLTRGCGGAISPHCAGRAAVKELPLPAFDTRSTCAARSTTAIPVVLTRPLAPEEGLHYLRTPTCCSRTRAAVWTTHCSACLPALVLRVLMRSCWWRCLPYTLRCAGGPNVRLPSASRTVRDCLPARASPWRMHWGRTGRATPRLLPFHPAPHAGIRVRLRPHSTAIPLHSTCLPPRTLLLRTYRVHGTYRAPACCHGCLAIHHSFRLPCVAPAHVTGRTLVLPRATPFHRCVSVRLRTALHAALRTQPALLHSLLSYHCHHGGSTHLHHIHVTLRRFDTYLPFCLYLPSAPRTACVRGAGACACCVTGLPTTGTRAAAHRFLRMVPTFYHSTCILHFLPRYRLGPPATLPACPSAHSLLPVIVCTTIQTCGLHSGRLSYFLPVPAR